MRGKGAKIAGVLPLFMLFIAGTISAFDDIERLRIWPLPAQVSHGGRRMYLSGDFKLVTEGSKYGDTSGILKEGFDRMLGVVRLSHVISGDRNSSGSGGSALLQGLHVIISSSTDELEYGADESYKLVVPSPEKPSYAQLEAKSVYGALHGLQTFSQLCHLNLKKKVIEILMTPWSITDQPRFSYRGLLIDTSRHYLPLPVIKNVIDSMTYAKLNVLHWHIVDTQSFPLEIPSYPKLWNGAYSSSQRYTFEDAVEIVNYAQRRGIHVLAEIDVPGHALSWGKGYPALWPSKNCQEPLDVSNDFTFKVIDGILSDFSKIFKFKFVHLGGDEVNTTCWSATPRIAQWLKKHRMSEEEAYQYFVLRAQKIALSHGYEIINWEETFINFGSKLNSKTVVHNWLNTGLVQNVTASGLRCIVSNQENWYLDHIDAPWQGFYANEPLKNITDKKQQSLVLGGEVCMWGEHIDASDIEQTIWPRAAAAAERLWTPYAKLAKNPNKVTTRLAHFRCLLNRRGVAAAPLVGGGRVVPLEPGSCLAQ
ncbi:Glycoside hydrolase family 20 catalytic domain [Arabidopsis thaliana x Arabidopsis arenosa]|uniref:Beta-hexosaminidase n=1 Tax=Arabidopsis thaliana x Arabidopsis arenosa TaxID=1240361 RepID=A0A8T2BK76_9BRAS|nr:Glycoside hydrolase family 20 catalytic domain [Arabidopsis thaliana x Arabidopsis arenosa]